MAFNPLNILVALVILILGLALGNLTGRAVKRFIITLELKKFFKFSIELIASRVASYLVYTLAVIFALINLGIATTILYTIIIILLVLIAAAVFLGLKDFIPNIIAGAKLQQRELKKGQIVKFNEISGEIDEITLTETKLKSGNDIIFVPNTLLLKNIVYVKNNKKRKK